MQKLQKVLQVVPEKTSVQTEKQANRKTEKVEKDMQGIS